MASNIVNTVPATGSALIAKPLRDNFAAAKSEIEALQLLAITNGNSHNHSGGDGGQIDYTSLSGLPTLGTAASTAATAYATAAQGSTADKTLQTEVDQRIFGFMVSPDCIPSWDESTYTFTLTPIGTTWSYYRNSVKYTITGAKSVTLPGTPPAIGMWYIIINDNIGTLSATQIGWTLGPTDSLVTVYTVEVNASLTPKSLIYTEMPVLHASTHLPNGSDPIPTTKTIYYQELTDNVTIDWTNSPVQYLYVNPVGASVQITMPASPGELFQEGILFIKNNTDKEHTWNTTPVVRFVSEVDADNVPTPAADGYYTCYTCRWMYNIKL